MAALGSILRKGANNLSAHRTTQYEKLAQDPSDNEEEDDVLFRQGNGVHVTGVTKLHNGVGSNAHATSNGNQESIEMDSMPTIHTARKLGSDVKVHLVRTGLLTRARIACFITVLFSGIGIAFGFAFILPYFTGKAHRSAVVIYHRSAPWTHILAELGTESSVRLVDVDGDGKQDVIFGTMQEFGFRVSTTDMMQSLCKQKKLPFPCVGIIMALRGTDGAELWRLMTYSGVTDLKCDVIDVNGDGRNDCIAAGRMGTLIAIDVRNGTVLWHGDSKVLNPAWNVYAPLILPDLDQDGVPEILIAHGGDDAFPHAKLVAHKLLSRMGAGRLVMLSGKTGKSLGRVFEMARKRQTYMPPILHTTSDGSIYVLFGTGESRVPGSLFMISVPDLYRYIRTLNKTADVPNTNGTYKAWPNLICDGHGLCEIFSSSMKGLMVPPVCVDLTGDGVRDVVMAAYDGTVMVRHGDTMKEVWKVAFTGYEAHSAPAPAYFNSDDTLDLMLHLNYGTWPRFNHSKVLVLDGKTGQTLWSLQTDQHEMTSDLVVRTVEANRDAYVFRVQGRHGKKPFGDGASSEPRHRRQAGADAPAYAPKHHSLDYDYPDYSDDYPRSEDRYQYLPEGSSYNPYRQYPQRYGSTRGGSDDSAAGEGYGRQRGAYRQGDSLENPLWPQQERRPSVFDGIQEEDSLYPEKENILFGGDIIPNSMDTLDHQSRKYNAPDDHLPGHDDSAVPPVPTPAPYISPCEHDMNKFNTEVFIMDRTLMHSPLKVTEIPATKLYYNLTSNDKKMLDSIRSAGTSRGRQVRETPASRTGQGLGQGQAIGQGQGQPLSQGQHLGQGQRLSQGQHLAPNPSAAQGQGRSQYPPPGQNLPPGQIPSRRRPAPGQGRSRGQVGDGGQGQGRSRGQVGDGGQGRPQSQVPLSTAAMTRTKPAVKVEPDKELCTVMAASEMVTGTLGDVDGDGSLDLVLMFDREAPIRAADGTYIRSEYVTEVTKVNLLEVLARKEVVPMNVSLPHPESFKTLQEKSFFQVQFRPVEKQPWTSYLGTRGDSIYKT